jgi:putative membrane protein
MKHLCSGILFSMALAAPLWVWADSGNPATDSPASPVVITGQPAGPVPNNADELFVKQISVGGRAEIETGRLALQRATRAQVKDFAQRMVDDHGSADGKLTTIARNAKVALRVDVDVDHTIVRKQLEGADTSSFDIQYVRAQIAEHQKTAQLLEWEIDAGKDPAILQYAASILPTVLSHLESAQQLLAELTGASVRMDRPESQAHRTHHGTD